MHLYVLETQPLDAEDDHFFDAFTSRTCHGHPLPCNKAGACVSEADADAIHELGHFEYKYVSAVQNLEILLNSLDQLYMERCGWLEAIRATHIRYTTFLFFFSPPVD